MLKFRIANTLSDMTEVYHLAYDVYLEQQYTHPNPEGLLRHYPELDGIEATTVILAEEDGLLVGTNSLTMDSMARLHTDRAFPEETQSVREECFEENRRLAASWRICTMGEGRCGMRVLMGLIGCTYKLVVGWNLQTVLYTFHPKHARIYEKIIGARVIAGPVADRSVDGSPAVLMRTDLETLVPHWTRMSKRRSFFTDLDFSGVGREG